MRDNFTLKTKDILAKRVGYKCSNPECRTLTCGPKSIETDFISIGVAAHITAASKNGPRYNPKLTPSERTSPKNGIWLCQNCAKLVDNDPELFKTSLLESWKNDAELLALNKMSKATNRIAVHPELLQQLSTFARVEFSYGLPLIGDSEESKIKSIQFSSSIVFNMIACSYLQTQTYLKRDKFVFGLTLNYEIENGYIYYQGELITHLTPFGYFFGIFADLLNEGSIDEIIDYINSFPTIKIKREYTFGQFKPYVISRVNPAKISIELNKNRFIFEKGILTTSDLLTLLASSLNTGIIMFDDINDPESFTKIVTLWNKIEDGFDMSEVSIDTDDAENWFVNND
ncbi:hypothetical protein [uncultured Roseivirga sp.]|uniref:hypothetical protein n=1 Tax=uncultured Roseivirga sp. TaxID=543088 RepID=UPI000D78DE2A|nr:hypothetical protein [uncultured Roseivirga sp.]PWL29052.1 MAG: hypothetical protein DCO95_11475 [Roseivirga sp. XM-24bin3]